jgi:hypothetical protein
VKGIIHKPRSLLLVWKVFPKDKENKQKESGIFWKKRNNR